MNAQSLWENVTFAFPILTNKIHSDCTHEDFLLISEQIIKLDLAQTISESVIKGIETHLRNNVSPLFWSKFTSCTVESEGFQLFQDAVVELWNTLRNYNVFLERLALLSTISNNKKLIYGEEDVFETFKLVVRATLLSQLPTKHETIVHGFYNIAFKVFASTNNDADYDDSLDDVVRCGGCGFECEQCRCQHIVKVFHQVNMYLTELGLLERLAGQVLTTLIQDRISTHVRDTCKGSFYVSHVGSLEKWLDTVVMSWLIRIYCKGSSSPFKDDVKIMEALEKFKQKLSYYLYDIYTCTRIEQLFNIIIEYPDSLPAVEDLRICLQKTELRPYLTRTLQEALQTRLLHPGVNTPDILTAYVAAIKALRHLDSTGVLLETITEPVRLYLRSREDTVRCVVTSLTEDGTSELAEELVKSEVPKMEEGVEMSEEILNWETWNPDPVDADPSKPSTGRRTNDIISMLVDVYGSKELFVNEYRTLLADRLLTQTQFNPEREIRNLELLKLRFGDAQLHNCEVMLKDVTDSKRINAHIQSDKVYNEEVQFTTSVMIVSAQFWPPFKEETLELPSLVKQQMEKYTKAFEAHKGNRTLCWKPHLGHVNIVVELADRKLNLTVSPTQATIIMLFQDKDQWTLEELGRVMKVPPSVLRRKMSFWQSQGILRELTPDCFLLIEKYAERGETHSTSQDHCEEEEAESAMASTSDQREEDLQVFWSYIVGMLTNLDSLALERIHQMLKMFALQGPAVECSLQELKHFLERKVREHKLLFISGLYRLPKP